MIEKLPNKFFVMFCNIACFSKLCYQMFDLFFIFSAQQKFGGKVFYRAALRMQKIAADKVNIMKCYSESTLVTSNFSTNSNSLHYYLTIHETLRKICGLETSI